MSATRFRSSAIDLELRGSESFVARQLHRLAPYLGSVDEEALTRWTSGAAPSEAPAVPQGGVHRIEQMPTANGDEDDLLAFYSSFSRDGRDTQIDAALLFAYYLQNRECNETLEIGDLIRCCIRVGVDTGNFNRVLGTLTRRGFLHAFRSGHGYQLSEQGVAAVESRM